MFLGIHVPSNIERRWNFPPFGPLVHPQLVQELVPKQGCWMSIVHVSPFLVGVLWLETGDPELGASIYSHDFYHGALSLLEMIPLHISISIFEVDAHIQAVLKNL